MILVSPSFMRRMSLAASRFLSRLQSSFRDTNPLRSSFSTYYNTHTKHVSVSTHYNAHKKPKCIQSETYMSVLGIIEEIQRIPAQTGPQSPGCLSHRNKQYSKGILLWQQQCQFFHVCTGYFPFLLLPHLLSQEMDMERATAAVSLGPWVSAIPCT